MGPPPGVDGTGPRAHAGRAVTYQDGSRCEWLVEEPLTKTVCHHPSGGMRVCLWELVDRTYFRECFEQDRRTMVDFVPPPVWPTDDVGPRHAVTRYATFDGHPCEGFFVNELGHMKCGTSATAGNPPYDCFPKRAPRVIFADCRYQGEFVTHSVELPLSWWPS